MKRFFRLALLTLPLALVPQIGLAQSFRPPLSVGFGDPHFGFGDPRLDLDFQDLPIIVEDLQALIHADEIRNEAEILTDEAALAAAINDFLTGVPASPAV
jgi:hypothetical protein